MRLLRLLVLVFVLFSQNGLCQSFTYLLSQPDNFAGFEAVQLDNSYELYVKQICKKVSNKIVTPCNCSDPQSNGEVIEQEFLFLSEKHQRAVVINYVKDRNQRLYLRENSTTKVNLQSSGDIDVNVRYFNQLRFGNYCSKDGYAVFQTKFKPYTSHLWSLKKQEDAVLVYSVTSLREDGGNVRNSKSSLILPPLFVKASGFKLIYQSSGKKKDDQEPEKVPVKNNMILLDMEKGCIFFEFDEPVFKLFKYIRFKKNRWYSYFNKDAEANPCALDHPNKSLLK